MRKLHLTLLLSFIVTIATAQKSSIDKAVDSACKCLTDAKSKIKSERDFDKYAENCIIKSASPLFVDIAKEEGIDMEDLDKDGAEKIGTKIGLRLVTACPQFVDLVSQFSLEEDEDVGGELEGNVSNVEVTDHVYVHLKDENGKITKTVWVGYFQGSDDFKSDPLTLKGKKVLLEWKQMELYSVKQKDFITVKAISKLEVE